MSTLLQDVRYGIRGLRRSPGFAGVVALILSLAIGANSVLFSFVYVLLLRKLPIQDIETVAFIEGLNPQRDDDRLRLSPADYLDYAERAESFDDLGAYRLGGATLTGDGEPRYLTIAEATASFFRIWGLPTSVGRTFLEEEDAPGAPRVVLLSHGYWTRHHAASPDVLERTLMLDGRPHQVVGVLSPEIEIGGFSEIDVWLPMAIDPAAAARTDRALRVTGRLAPGVGVEQASAEVAAIAKELQAEHPDTNQGFEALVRSARASLMGGPQLALIFTLLTVIVAGVLSVACANVANLVLARSVGRRRELSIRSALGAGRIRIVRQLLTEGTLLGAAGGVGGLVVAWAGLKLIRALAHEPIFEIIVVNPAVMAFAAGLSLLTPLLFGAWPALQVAREDIAQSLKDTGGRGSTGPAGRRARSALVVSQLALACSLLVAASLVVRTVEAVYGLSWGFDHEPLAAFVVDLPDERYPTAEDVRTFHASLVAGLRALPGSAAAAGLDPLPVLGGERTVQLEIEGQLAQRPEDRPWAARIALGDGALEALGVPLLQGRGIEERDRQGGVALVSRTLADRYWPGGSALGRRLAIYPDAPGAELAWLEVVGVTGDVRSPDLDGDLKPTVFVSLAAEAPRRASFVVRAEGDPANLIADIRNEAHRLDAELALMGLNTLRQQVREEQSSDRVISGMFGAFALVALLMASMGLYAAMAYSVSQRAQEIGIRMALGASAGEVVTMVLAHGAASAGWGSA